MLYNLFENRDFVSVFAVALLAEGVDRNKRKLLLDNNVQVALLAEGVDRNPPFKQINNTMEVALLAEGVDRNSRRCTLMYTQNASPSSRRAWIEIYLDALNNAEKKSPSSRRAWIEMPV